MLGDSKIRMHRVAVAAFISAVALALPSVVAFGEKPATNFGGVAITLPTTADDFFQQGTQPLGVGAPSSFNPLLAANECSSCHAGFGTQDPFLVVEEFGPWAASMMGQSARDPLFHAALTVANQTLTDSGVFCIRCHAPNAFLNNPGPITDISQMSGHDFEGLSCNFCHRIVNPEFVPGVSPAQDEQILNELATAGLMPPEATNARYLIDPTDSRRGPFDDIPLNVHPGDPQPSIVHSPFHTSAEFCWTCHDVSNPLMSKQPNGTYVLNNLDEAHPTGAQLDMMPLHRTYSEWKNSYYSSIGVQHNGRFGGNHATGIMKSCQDCHMPRVEGYGCNFEFDPFFSRPDVPQHSFMGSNTWVLNAIRTVDANDDGVPDFPDRVTNLSETSVAWAIERNVDFLQRASDLVVSKTGQNLNIRLINMTGHKLPTGFPDGRRIWINVKFFNCNEQIVDELGAYDFETAELVEDTKVYEIELGIEGADYAASVGLPEGHTFHFMLANTILKDNRIPPTGYFNIIAEQNQTAPVGAVYANGQNYDDTFVPIPSAARKAVVTVNYQLVSKEFIEFLRDTNITDNRGQVAYDLWVEHGMSTPVEMDFSEITFFRPEDIDQDGNVGVPDLLAVINGWGTCVAQPCPADLNGDNAVGVPDLLAIINAWESCPTP